MHHFIKFLIITSLISLVACSGKPKTTTFQKEKISFETIYNNWTLKPIITEFKYCDFSDLELTRKMNDAIKNRNYKEVEKLIEFNPYISLKMLKKSFENLDYKTFIVLYKNSLFSNDMIINSLEMNKERYISIFLNKKLTSGTHYIEEKINDQKNNSDYNRLYLTKFFVDRSEAMPIAINNIAWNKKHNVGKRIAETNPQTAKYIKNIDKYKNTYITTIPNRLSTHKNIFVYKDEIKVNDFNQQVNEICSINNRRYYKGERKIKIDFLFSKGATGNGRTLVKCISKYKPQFAYLREKVLNSNANIKIEKPSGIISNLLHRGDMEGAIHMLDTNQLTQDDNIEKFMIKAIETDQHQSVGSSIHTFLKKAAKKANMDTFMALVKKEHISLNSKYIRELLPYMSQNSKHVVSEATQKKQNEILMAKQKKLAETQRTKKLTTFLENKNISCDSSEWDGKWTEDNSPIGKGSLRCDNDISDAVYRFFIHTTISKNQSLSKGHIYAEYVKGIGFLGWGTRSKGYTINFSTESDILPTVSKLRDMTMSSFNEKINSQNNYSSTTTSSGVKSFDCTYRCRTTGFIGFDKSDYSMTVQASTNSEAVRIVERASNKHCKKLNMWSTSYRCEQQY